ncbi:glycosyltransferase family 2 protein [Sphingobium baderi]|uniref:Glycosyl transferase n=1 Tax=Sphingobium baderi LL03 TaxID=1114964 RepID=T0HDC6_9SPHN|nr:glycosyltransferase family 2 protein [Sphingobium baderi]EQA97384.1 glycosyl transferase [Sphingobium baderi LL03]KMS63807.1 glycosyl transferase [Sphingobium baderi LL03]
MTTPFFSVVIPLYNRAAQVGETIRSVLSQDWTDYEIVVVDDGSRDDPQPVIEAIGDPRIRYIRQDNAGGGAARNAGIIAAEGRYIAFLDSDDLFLPGKLSTMAKALDGDDGLTVLYSRMKVDRGVDRYWIRPDRGIREDEDVGEYLFCANQFMQTSTMVVSTPLAQDVLFDPALKKGQDLDFCVRLQGAGARFHMIEQPLTIWLDATEAGRTSYVKGYETSLDWLERCGHMLTGRARRGYRATVLAYHMAPIRPVMAIRDLIVGFVAGGVPPKIIARQILRSYLPKPLYRSLVNGFVLRFGKAEPLSHGAKS